MDVDRTVDVPEYDFALMKDFKKLAFEARTNLQLREDIFNSSLCDCDQGKECQANATRKYN